jgi:hypothetical protein
MLNAGIGDLLFSRDMVGCGTVLLQADNSRKKIPATREALLLRELFI